MIAMVTGGTRGIGLAIVKAFKAQTYTVASVSRHPHEEQVVDLSIQADLCNANARRGLVQSVIDELGGIDILVNNAGEQNFESAKDYNFLTWQRNLSLMLTAPFDLSQQAATWMLDHGGGHIINILSISAFQGARNIVGYVAAKHGLLGVTRSMAIELAPKIHVNAVAPGLVETDMTKSYITPERKAFLESITPAGRFCKPKEIADAVLYLAKSTAIYGQTIVVDNGWLAKNG